MNDRYKIFQKFEKVVGEDRIRTRDLSVTTQNRNDISHSNFSKKGQKLIEDAKRRKLDHIGMKIDALGISIPLSKFTGGYGRGV